MFSFYILATTFCIAILVQLGYWLFLFARLAFYDPPKLPKIEPKDEPPVSIIICAKNEEKNLEAKIDRFLNQNYRSFEILLINDNSTDDTAQVILRRQAKHHNLRLVNLKADFTERTVGKKNALAKGIEMAQFDLLLLTDADCAPASNDWLRQMQGAMQSSADIVLGYSPYEHRAGFLNLFIHYETVYTAVQYLSFALAGVPYMGVGRNLMYRRGLFYEAGGFKKHEKIASGDDDLFISQVAHRKNTVIQINADSFVFSEPKTTWKAYFRQKSRHVTTAKYYTKKHKLLLGILPLSHFWIYFGVIALSLKFSMVFAASFYVFRVLAMMVLYARILEKLGEQRLLWWIPVLDFFHVLYYIVLFPALTIGKTNRWK